MRYFRVPKYKLQKCETLPKGECFKNLKWCSQYGRDLRVDGKRAISRYTDSPFTSVC